MRLVADIDGVCADTLPVMLNMLNRHYGKSYTLSDCRDYCVWQLYGGPEAYEFLVQCYPVIFATARPVSGAPEALRLLEAEGWEVAYLTARNERYARLTREWLQRYGFPRPWAVYHSFDKPAAARALRPDVIVEDSASNAQELAAAGFTVALLDYPYNYSCSGVHRVRGWDGLLILLDYLFGIWRCNGQHECTEV